MNDDDETFEKGMTESEKQLLWRHAVKDALKQINDKLDKMIAAVDGGRGEPGLILKVDRLQTGQKIIIFIGSVLFTAITGVIIGFVFKGFK